MTRTSRWQFSAAIAILVALSVGSAIPAGRLSDRWGEPPDRIAAAERLAKFPVEFGEWRQTDANELSDSVVGELRCTGHIERDFTNRLTGKIASVIVLVGPPGPTVRHPPEICYGNIAKVLAAPKTNELTDAEDASHRFKVFEFAREGLLNRRYAVAYGWCAGDAWDVPTDPRVDYGAEPLLYKIQVMVSVDPEATSPAEQTWAVFLRDFIPVFRRKVQQAEGG